MVCAFDPCVNLSLQFMLSEVSNRSHKLGSASYFSNQIVCLREGGTIRMDDSRLTPAGTPGAVFTSNSHRDKTNERGHKRVKKEKTGRTK